MEAFAAVDEDRDALIRAFEGAVADRAAGRVIVRVPDDLARDAISIGSLDDTVVVQRLRAAGRAVHAHYVVRADRVTFVVQWPCGTLKVYDVASV